MRELQVSQLILKCFLKIKWEVKFNEEQGRFLTN